MAASVVMQSGQKNGNDSVSYKVMELKFEVLVSERH